MRRQRYHLIACFLPLLQLGCAGTPDRDLKNAPLTGPGESVRIGFGSCNNHSRSQSYWNNINAYFGANSQAGYPDLWIWGGDIVYADTDDGGALKAAYDSVATREYATFARECKRNGCRILGIWDDHDFGGNNLVGDPVRPSEAATALRTLGKPARKAALVNFLGEPTKAAVAERAQTYYSYDLDRAGLKTRISLLDLRWDRQAPGSNARIMSESQWAWLADNLADPDVTLHLIVTSTQVLRTDTRKDTWGEYPRERTRLLRLLGKHRAQGLLLLSGDIHAAEVSRLGYTEEQHHGIDFPLYEITASGLNRLRCILGICDYGWENPYREGFAAKKNFGEIIAQRDSQGNLLIDATLRASDSPETEILLRKGIRFPPR
jgi:alkaline phosphatase D